MPRRAVGGEGKKSPLNMRTTAAFRQKLEDAAQASGRSLAQETEFRLEHSFATDTLVGRDLAELQRMISLALALTPRGSHRDRQVGAAIFLITESFLAGGGKQTLAKILEKAAAVFDPAEHGVLEGVEIARIILQQAGLVNEPAQWSDSKIENKQRAAILKEHGLLDKSAEAKLVPQPLTEEGLLELEKLILNGRRLIAAKAAQQKIKSVEQARAIIKEYELSKERGEPVDPPASGEERPK